MYGYVYGWGSGEVPAVHVRSAAVPVPVREGRAGSEACVYVYGYVYLYVYVYGYLYGYGGKRESNKKWSQGDSNPTRTAKTKGKMNAPTVKNRRLPSPIVPPEGQFPSRASEVDQSNDT